MKYEHQAIYKCAADAVTQAKKGDKAGAQKATGFGSRYAQLSSKLVNGIAQLRANVESR